MWLFSYWDYDDQCASLRVSSLLWAFLLTTILASCGGPRDIIGVDDPNLPVSDIDRLSEEKIFIATTRAPSSQEGTLFSSDRGMDLGLAAVTVTIPPSHERGQLEYPRSLPPDPRTEFSVLNPIRYSSNTDFLRALNAELDQRPPGRRDILLFIHGYNNTTSDAVLRLAQFVHDSGFEGVPLLLSWASAARPAKYVYDLNSTLIARDRIPELQQLLDRTNADSYDLFAHSMGSLLAMEGLVESAKRGNSGTQSRLQNVILAAPDIDLDLFRSQLIQLQSKHYNLFVLLSEDDKTLRLSRVLAGGVPRVGNADANRLNNMGVVVVDLTQVDDQSSTSHSRFASSPEVVQLIGRGLNGTERFDVTDGERRLDAVLIGASIRVLFY